MKKKPTYKDAFDELQRIVSEIETGAIHVDELSAKIHRASELIAVCRAKLTASEEEVEKLLQQLSATETEKKEGKSETEE